MVTRPRKRYLPAVFLTNLCLRWKKWGYRLKEGEGIFRTPSSRVKASLPAPNWAEVLKEAGYIDSGRRGGPYALIFIFFFFLLPSPRVSRITWCPHSFFWC